MRGWTWSNVPPTEVYVAGLAAIEDRISHKQRRLLQAQYDAEYHTVTAPQLAELLGLNGFGVVNLLYGRLGRIFCEYMGIKPEMRKDRTYRWWSVWSSLRIHPDGVQWIMHPQVASALEILSWVTPRSTVCVTLASSKASVSTNQNPLLPHSIDETVVHYDDQAVAADLQSPTRVEYTTRRIVRDTTLTRKLKHLYQSRCQICNTTIALPNGTYYAEAHHLQPLGSPHHGPDIEENIIILCPNHHAMCDYAAISLDLSTLRIHSEHNISIRYLNYHNQEIVLNGGRGGLG